jgi:hypothetical protein
MIERALVGMVLRRIYHTDLARLDAYARSRAAVAV